MPKHVPKVTPPEALAIARLWDPGAQDVTHVRDGENSVWRLEGRGGHIMRVTSDTHRTRHQLHGELAFIEHLVAHGLNVSPSVESLSGEQVVEVSRMVGCEGSIYAMVFKRLEGRHFEDFSSDIGRPLFRTWGQVMGRLHVLSGTFVAPPALRRAEWDDDEVAGCSVDGLDIDDGLLRIRNELVGWLSATTRNPGHYGMVHGDLERTNFVLHEDTIGIYDFDDCCRHWFCWDIACALWRFRNAPPDDRSAFLGWFLEGYAVVREPEAAMLERFSELIRLRTVSLLLYRARACEAPATDEWWRRTRSSLDLAWTW